MKVLVTGAAGLIGRATVAALHERGHEVRAIDRLPAPSGMMLPGLEWMTSGLDSESIARAAVAGMHAVVHLAAIPAPGSHPDEVVYLNNTAATFRVLSAAGEAKVPRAVIASSISILGLVFAGRELSPPSLPITESSPLQVADAYALSKRADEAISDMACRRWGMTVLAYRFPDVGAGDRLRSRARAVQADPSYARRELWAYLHVEDAARAICLGVESDLGGCHVLNVVAQDSLGSVDVAGLVERFYPGVPITAPIPPGASAYTTDRAARLLAFRSKHRWND